MQVSEQVTKRKRINISIIGASHSKDLFDKRFIEDYKEYFRVKSYYSVTSILSIMSKTVDYNFNNLMNSGFHDNQLENWYFELEKSVLKGLQSKKPDVLLMDFYADARYGARSYGGDYMVDKLKKLKDKKVLDWNKYGIVYNYKSNTSDFIMMWRNRFDRFMDFMSESLPETQIVINTVKGTNIVSEKDGSTYINPALEGLDIESINQLWEELDDYAIRKYKLKAITFQDEYTLDPDYEYGLGVSMVHFHKDYYRDCFETLRILTSGVKRIENKETDINLVPDSAFQYGLKRWTKKAGEFEIIEKLGYSIIKAVDCRKTLGKYHPQIWSRPIEIEGSGKVPYTLSFYIKIDDMSQWKEEWILFAIRTFVYVKGVNTADAYEEYKLTLENHTIQEGQEYRYEYTFMPKGRFIRLAPFMFKFVPGVEYSRIKLERGTVATKYTK